MVSFDNFLNDIALDVADPNDKFAFVSNSKEGTVVVRPTSDLTLTVDHRVADGRLASRFLARVVEILEGRDWRVE